MITLKSCPNCESYQIKSYPEFGTDPHVLYEIMPGVKVDAAILRSYCICSECGVIFQNPRMTDAHLNEFYSGGYYRRSVNGTEGDLDSDEAIRASVDSDIIKRYIDHPKSHLDIGCGRGYLLKEVGADLKVGVEPDTSFVRLKGANIYPRISQVPNKKFDLVTAVHLLEHVPHPLDYLKKMVEFIGKDGYVTLVVPARKGSAKSLRLAHLYHFEPDTLKLMCTRVGLKVVEMRFTPNLLLVLKKIRRGITNHILSWLVVSWFVYEAPTFSQLLTDVC